MAKEGNKQVLWSEEERAAILRFIEGLRLDMGRPWQVVVKRFYESPSDRQRAYYRSTVLKALCDFTGYDEEEMHEYCKQRFGQKARIEVDGVACDVVAFTTSGKGKLDAMSAYMDMVIKWAARDLGVYIPPPREKWQRKEKAA